MLPMLDPNISSHSDSRKEDLEIPYIISFEGGFQLLSTAKKKKTNQGRSRGRWLMDPENHHHQVSRSYYLITSEF